MAEEYGRALGVGLEGGFEGWTVRRYLRELLSAVWSDGEGFSGKGPFGNSDWDYDLYLPLGRAGFIELEAPNPLYPDQLVPRDERAAHVFVSDLILFALRDPDAP